MQLYMNDLYPHYGHIMEPRRLLFQETKMITHTGSSSPDRKYVRMFIYYSYTSSKDCIEEDSHAVYIYINIYNAYCQ